jgi:hypothetical protein
MSSNDKPTTDKTDSDKPKTESKDTSVISTIIDDIKGITDQIFTSSNLIILIWFLAVYIVAYSVIGTFNSPLSGPSFVLKIVDICILVAIFAYIISYYYKNQDTLKNIKTTTYETLNNTNNLVYSGIFLVCYSAIVFLFHIPTDGPEAPLSLWLLNTLAIIVFTITAIVAFCKYVLGISILDVSSLKSVLEGEKKPEESKDQPATEPVDKNEVFNITNNLYTYDDARAVCSAYGARLATYDEIEAAYNKGGEWCNYGWSEGQMAYFPTQKSTWNKLQANPSTKNNCGRPGINGGYMQNPYIKFGVNCYGVKPTATDKDLQAMKTSSLVPKTEEDLLMEKKVKFWKENADKLLNINSFNRSKWSEY